MKTSLYKGLPKSEQEEVKRCFTSSALIRERLSNLCEDKIEQALKTSSDQYTGPNWCYEQADSIGYRRAMKEIISLLSN